MNEHIHAEEFAAYVDGLLSADKKNELETHFSQCPVCLDELAEITVIMGGRPGKTPAEFLTKALGKKKQAGKSVLHLRLVFEVAAVLVVVVFIGYLFLGNPRFWQTPEQQKPVAGMEKDFRPGDASTAVPTGDIASLKLEQRNRAEAGKANNERIQTEADQRLADSFMAEKSKSTFVDKGMPVTKNRYVPAGKQENRLQEITVEKLQAVTGQENLPKKELARSTTENEALSDVQSAFAAKDERDAKAMGTQAGGVEQNLEKQKEPGVGAALPMEAKKSQLQNEEIALKSSVMVPAAGGSVHSAFSPIRIEGDAVWTDLLNPELFIAWAWFQKGLVLELQIDSAGAVTAVVPLGKFDQPLARQAESEAKKLLFSVSKKKSRRARLLVNEKPPSPR